MLKRLKAIPLAVATLATTALVATPAGAITGGTEDTANTYSNVAFLLYYADDGGRYRCTGTLVSENVVLTAAHCTDGTIGQTLVTFDPVIAYAPPSGLPRATDDLGDGTSAIGYQYGQPLPEGYFLGGAATHPEYSDFSDPDSWNDVGVVVLPADGPLPDAEPAVLAPVGYLDQFAPRVLNHTLFTLVGYGTEVRKSDSGPQKPTPQNYPMVRRYTDEVGQKLTPQILQTNGNEHDVRGGGGTCFGDSGGPSFHDGYLTTVTSYGYTDNCRYLGGLQRVDIAVVQSWLATFGVVAAAPEAA